MQRVSFHVLPRDHDRLTTILWELHTLGTEESQNTLHAFFEDTADLTALLRAFPDAATEPVSPLPPEPVNFADWEPVSIGHRFIAAPSWSDIAIPPGRTKLIADPLHAFGSGRHETTQLVIEAIGPLIQPHHRVFDIGCGSGILGQAALALGAKSVISCDIDEPALHAARQHLHKPFFCGSADSIRSASSDLTLVNISSRIIDALADDINRITAATGAIVLAGFVRENPPEQFKPLRSYNRNDWLCYVCRPSPMPAKQSAIRVHQKVWW